MFDDDAQPQATDHPGQMPPHVAPDVGSGARQTPSDEIPDMFDGSQNDPAIHTDLSPDSSMAGPSALEAGKMIPKTENAQNAPPSQTPSDLMPAPHDPMMMQAPSSGSKIIIATVVVAVIVLIVGGVWWFMNRVPAMPKLVAPVGGGAPVPAGLEKLGGEKGLDIDVTAPPSQVPVATSTPSLEPEPTPAPVPEPEPEVDLIKDTDKDGLPDAKEGQIGTDFKSADSDSDGLTDGAEVNIWGTDPLKKDTDGDSFPDGQEVMNGFNPKGPGKLQ